MRVHRFYEGCNCLKDHACKKEIHKTVTKKKCKKNKQILKAPKKGSNMFGTNRSLSIRSASLRLTRPKWKVSETPTEAWRNLTWIERLQIFDIAAKEIERLLRTDTFPRFRATDQFFNLIKMIPNDNKNGILVFFLFSLCVCTVFVCVFLCFCVCFCVCFFFAFVCFFLCMHVYGTTECTCM